MAFRNGDGVRRGRLLRGDDSPNAPERRLGLGVRRYLSTRHRLLRAAVLAGPYYAADHGEQDDQRRRSATTVGERAGVDQRGGTQRERSLRGN